MNITTPKDYFYQVEKSQKMNKKNIILITLGIVCLVLIGYFFGGQKIAFAPSKDDLETASNDPKAKALATTPSSKIIISNQIPGEVVLVTEITMIEAGWVAVHDNVDGLPGKILGAYFLPAGTHKNQMVPLLRGVAESNAYFVAVHKDNGDKIFDFKIDTLVTNSLGQIETAGFNVIAESPRGE